VLARESGFDNLPSIISFHRLVGCQLTSGWLVALRHETEWQQRLKMVCSM